ncbi:MAG: nucleotide sugar dehydrogenase, partial [Parachlamydiaceae bacterium]
VPEIADIGNSKFSFTDVPRIVSGTTNTCLNLVELLYKQLGCKTVRSPSTGVAEAAKLLQNAFRLVNISFINEMKILFDKMGLDVWDVIAAASSKPFGFMPFYPSPGIGGDCIPIAPIYLIWKAKATEGPATMLEDARRINGLMPAYVVNKLVQGLNAQKKMVNGSKILVLGVGYKKDVNDDRESPALRILPALKNMNADVSYNDPFVKEIIGFPEHPHLKMKSVSLNYDKLHLYDAIVIVTDHDCYNWEKIVANSQLVVDTRNVTARIKGNKKNVIKA